MSEEKKNQTVKNNQTAKKPINSAVKPATAGNKSGRSVYADRKRDTRGRRKSSFASRGEKDEFDQQIVDIARVTRVMAGGKRMRFRACVALGNKKGKVAIGIAKGADVSIAVNKAVNKAKKEIIDLPIVNETIPHAIFQKFGSAKVLLKPARKGKGIIAGGAVRTVLGLSGIKNITTKNLGTNNKVNVAKCTIIALGNLKKVEVKKEKKIENNKREAGAKDNKEAKNKS